MQYFFYAIDLDLLENLKTNIYDMNTEDALFDIKTSGEYLDMYNERQYFEIIGKLGKTYGKYFTHTFIDLVELKKIYEYSKEFKDEKTQTFRLMIYKAIGECRGLVIWKMEVEKQPEIATKWYEFWKK